MFNDALALAAFAFVAFMLAFAHPASQASRIMVHQTGAGSHVANAAIADLRSHLAASK